jgi:hypothetical protein
VRHSGIVTLALAVLISLATQAAAVAHDGVHYTTTVTSASTYKGTMRQLEVTNPSVKWNSNAYFTAPAWWIRSGGGYGEIGWAEWGDVSTLQYLYVRSANQVFKSGVVSPGQTVSVRMYVKEDTCPLSPGGTTSWIYYQIWEAGSWQAVGGEEIGGASCSGSAHLTYNYRGPSDANLNHGEWAQLPAGENVNNYDAKTAAWDSAGYPVWNPWGNGVSTATSNFDPYYNGYSAHYTDFYGYCSGTCS